MELVAVVDTLHMPASGQHRSWGFYFNVLDAFETWSMELVAIVDLLHMSTYDVAHACLCLTRAAGGAYNELDAFETGSTELVAVVDMLHMPAYVQPA